jgi:probable rRNA maturation factor
MDPDSPVVLFRTLPPALRLSAEEKSALRKFALDLSTKVAQGRPFTCLITQDREMRKLNKEFLQHDYPTDVLSFPSEDAGLGDLAISVERAEAQAREFGHDRIQELQVLMLHGLLHLLGHDHERDRGEMARQERKWRSEFKLPATLIARMPRMQEAAQ